MDSSEVSNQLLCHAISKILFLRVAGEVSKRQHRQRFDSWRISSTEETSSHVAYVESEQSDDDKCEDEQTESRCLRRPARRDRGRGLHGAQHTRLQTPQINGKFLRRLVTVLRFLLQTFPDNARQFWRQPSIESARRSW